MSSPNVAVVGGGIAGCSAAWFLRQALGEGASLTVYERDSQLGGRLATLDVGGTPVESGGTIIHETNRYLANFVDHLALERVEPHQCEEGDADSVGVWDGRRFAFRTRNSVLMTRLAAVLSFGVVAPLRLQRAVARGVEQWNQVYEHLERGTAFDSPAALCSELGLAELLYKDGPVACGQRCAGPLRRSVRHARRPNHVRPGRVHERAGHLDRTRRCRVGGVALLGGRRQSPRV